MKRARAAKSTLQRDLGFPPSREEVRSRLQSVKVSFPHISICAPILVSLESNADKVLRIPISIRVRSSVWQTAAVSTCNSSSVRSTTVHLQKKRFQSGSIRDI